MLLVLVSLLGLCNSVAFSTSYQVVTHFSTTNSVALTTGEARTQLYATTCKHRSVTPALLQIVLLIVAIRNANMVYINELTYACWSGFVASGPLVVLAEAALRMGSKPSYIQQMLLFQLVAGLTLAGSQTAIFSLCSSRRAIKLQLFALTCHALLPACHARHKGHVTF